MIRNENSKRRLARFFEKSTKVLKTDTRYLAVSGYWTTLSRVGFLLSGLILAVGFANLLPPEKYGTYSYILSLAAIAGTFSLTGLGTTIVSAVARGVLGTLRWGVRTYLTWSFGTFVVSLILATYYVVNDNMTIAIGILIAGSFTPLLNGFKLYSAFLTGKKAFRKNTMYGVGRRFIPVGALLGTLLLTDNILTLLLVYFATNTITTFSVYRKVLKEYPEDDVPDQQTLRYSKELSLMNIFTNIAGSLDKILIFHFLGAAELAIYIFAMTPITQIQGSLRTLKTLVIPKIATRDLAEIKSTLPRKALLLLCAIVPMTILYIFCAPFIYKILFPHYAESVVYSQVLALTLLFFPIMLLTQTFVAHLKKRETWISTVILPFVRVGALVVLIPLYGLWGTVAALFVYNIASLLLNGMLFSTMKIDKAT